MGQNILSASILIEDRLWLFEEELRSKDMESPLLFIK
jgi:hypothetical protein